jgi:hypothetical protein
MLLDTGASHSFACASFVQQYNLPEQPSPTFVAQTATDQHVAISSIVPAYLAISSVRTQVTLRPLPTMLPHVDVVLGMDWMKANKAVRDTCARTCTITVAGKLRTLRASHMAASSAPVHQHATLAALRALRENLQIISATQADKLLKQGCKAHLALVQGHRHTGTACARCASAQPSNMVTQQALDQAKLVALLEEKNSVFQPVPAGLPPDRGIGHVILTLPGARPAYRPPPCRRWSAQRCSVK